MHPAQEIRGTKSKTLEGKRIVLAVTGSIAAVEDVKLARELVRHGAEVFPVMSEAATRIIHPDSLEFATGNRPIVALTGATEHVAMCGQVPDRCHLLLVAPSTSNTISKMALGIDDTPVTTFAVTAIGTGIPVIVVPAMHQSMYSHPVVQGNVEALKRLGVTFVGPVHEEGKAKMAPTDHVVSAVMRAVGPNDMKGMNVLVIGGSTREPIDSMRLVTNIATGRTGVSLAKSAYRRGADVTLWLGHADVAAPGYVAARRFSTVADLIKMARAVDRFDVIIVPAAIGDYAPQPLIGKIPSGKRDLTLVMRPLPKVISELRRAQKDSFIVGFKSESGLKWNEMVEKGKALMDKEHLDLVITNDILHVTATENSVAILSPSAPPAKKSGNKDSLADFILDSVVSGMGKR